MTGDSAESTENVSRTDGGYEVSPHNWACPEGCYIPLIDRMYASHRHECPNCGENLRRLKDIDDR